MLLMHGRKLIFFFLVIPLISSFFEVITLKKLNSEILITTFDEDYYQLFEFDLRFENYRIKIEDFGVRIIVEKKVVNNIGENVLEIDKNH